MTYRIFSIALAFFMATLSVVAQKTETRTLGSFESISISGGYDIVTLQAGDAERVDITATGVDLEKIETKIKDKNLSIGMKKGYNSWNDRAKINIVVTYKSINAIHNSGSTDVETRNVIKADEFRYHSSGSGDLKAEFDVAKLSIHISGSGDMSLKGQATYQDYGISGSGDIDAGQLVGEKAAVSISGSGDVDLNVSGNVRTSVSGSGDVNNKGGN